MKTILLLSLALSSASVAQTTTAPAKPILETALAQAKSDVVKIDQLLNIEAKKEKGYDACKVGELTAHQEYAQWFVAHYSEFEAAASSLKETMTTVIQKVDTLKDQTIDVLPVAGQTVDKLEVTLATMIDYFKIYNGRLSTCQKGTEDALSVQMENPKLNRLGMAHSQIVGAMERMTTNLNSSLKESNIDYAITFEKSECGYNLGFKATFAVGESKQQLSTSFIDPSAKPLKVATDEQIWILLVNANTFISGQSVQGFGRYQGFYQKELHGCPDALEGIEETQASAKPYLSYAEMSTTVAQLKAAQEKIAKELEASGRKKTTQYEFHLSKETILAMSARSIAAKVVKKSAENDFHFYYIYYKNCFLEGSINSSYDHYLGFYTVNEANASVPNETVVYAPNRSSMDDGILRAAQAFKDYVQSGKCE